MTSKHDKLKGFIIGIMIASIVLISTPAFAAVQQSISVLFNDNKIYVDDKEVTLKDANGKVLKPILYNGTNYLPLRAISQALGKEVNYDTTTKNVYVGCKAPTPTSTTYNGFFRNVNWGMTKSQVIASENKNPEIDEGGFFSYTAKINSVDCKVVYVCNESDQLCGIMITPDITHSNDNDWITDYFNFKTTLTSKYGQANDGNDQVWKDDIYKDDQNYWGLAISAGHLSYFATWNLNDATIQEILYGDNYVIKFGIVFKSKIYPQPTTQSSM